MGAVVAFSVTMLVGVLSSLCIAYAYKIDKRWVQYPIFAFLFFTGSAVSSFIGHPIAGIMGVAPGLLIGYKAGMRYISPRQ